MKKGDYGHFGKGPTGYSQYRTAFKRIHKNGKNNLLKSGSKPHPTNITPTDKKSVSDSFFEFLARFIIDFVIGAIICGAIVTVFPEIEGPFVLVLFILLLAACTFHSLFKSF